MNWRKRKISYLRNWKLNCIIFSSHRQISETRRAKFLRNQRAQVLRFLFQLLIILVYKSESLFNHFVKRQKYCWKKLFVVVLSRKHFFHFIHANQTQKIYKVIFSINQKLDFPFIFQPFFVRCLWLLYEEIKWNCSSSS